MGIVADSEIERTFAQRALTTFVRLHAQRTGQNVEYL